MFAFISRDSNRELTARAWTRIFALAFGGLCIASTQGDSPRVPMSEAIMSDDMGFCGRCMDWGGRFHLAAADPTQRFGVGPARPSVEETPWHAQVVRPGDCLWKHGICHNARGFKFRDPGELTDELAQAVASEDVAELVNLVDLPTVRIMHARSSIQVVACDGQTVVGHVPVDRALLEILTALPASSE